jgi:orotidine-5'-phosphate decarboxylase
LDYPDLKSALRGAEKVAQEVGVLKVGLELFIKEGPQAVTEAQRLGCEVFLDLKLHDIETTVERAVATAATLGVRYLTIHTCGGPGMMTAAAQRAHKENSRLCILGVTVLTSLGDDDLKAVGVSEPAPNQVLRLARLARECGLGGLVCSTMEVAAVRATVGSEMVLVTPGVRPPGSSAGDQKRVGTPSQAIQAGSDLLVVGRPIRDANDPQAAARAILAEMEIALS